RVKSRLEPNEKAAAGRAGSAARKPYHRVWNVPYYTEESGEMQEIRLELLGGNFLEDRKQKKKTVDNQEGEMYTDEEERFTNGGAAMDSLAEQIIGGARLGRRDDLGVLVEMELE